MGTGPGVSPRVELRLAGAFGVIRDGTELSEGELGSRKSRILLKLLAVERPGLVPLDLTRFRRAAQTPFNLVFEVRP